MEIRDNLDNEKSRRLFNLNNLIGEWAQGNFGENESKITGQKLHSLAPLLGLGEEVGELFTAIYENNDTEIHDSFGDCVVYLMDFIRRDSKGENHGEEYFAGGKAQAPPYTIVSFHPGFCYLKTSVFKKKNLKKATRGLMVDIPISLSKLFHCVLKRHQGIRGFLDQKKYEEARTIAIVQFYDSLDLLAQIYGLELTQVAMEVFQSVVAKRDWKVNPLKGLALDNTLSQSTISAQYSAHGSIPAEDCPGFPAPAQHSTGEGGEFVMVDGAGNETPISEASNCEGCGVVILPVNVTGKIFCDKCKKKRDEAATAKALTDKPAPYVPSNPEGSINMGTMPRANPHHDTTIQKRIDEDNRKPPKQPQAQEAIPVVGPAPKSPEEIEKEKLRQDAIKAGTNVTDVTGRAQTY